MVRVCLPIMVKYLEPFLLPSSVSAEVALLSLNIIWHLHLLILEKFPNGIKSTEKGLDLGQSMFAHHGEVFGTKYFPMMGRHTLTKIQALLH